MFDAGSFSYNLPNVLVLRFRTGINS